MHLYKCNKKILGVIMIVCCFGHRDAPIEMREKLKTALLGVMEEHGKITVYVGNHGGFDFSVVSVVRELQFLRYPVECYVVLSYVPTKINEFVYYRNHQTLVPEGIEIVHPKGAITYRNFWMIDKAEIVVGYVVKAGGGAANAIEYAKKKKKKIIYLS